MAGARETPSERQAREQSAAEGAILWVPSSAVGRQTEPGGPVEVLEPDDGPRWGRRTDSSDQRPMVASAVRIQLDDRKAINNLRRRRQAWQSEAYDYADEVPELGNTLEYQAALLSKMRLFPAVKPDPKGEPVAVDEEGSGVSADEAKIALATLERLRSPQGGQSALVGDIAYNLGVVGECSLHGHDDQLLGEEWYVRSIDELTVQGDRFVLRDLPGGNIYTRIPDSDVVIRLWVKHRRFSNLATSPVRRVLSAAENLLLLDRELRSTSMSRLPKGVILFPQGMSFGAADPTRDLGDGDARQDPFMADWDEAVRTAIQEPGAAAAAAPIAIQGPDEKLALVRFIEFGKGIDEALDKRIEAQVMRVARGLSMPVEVSTGLQETTFANASQVRQSEWDSYGEPQATLIVDALTAGYFQWALVEAGFAPERARDFFVWYDPTACIAAPDPVDNADHGLGEGAISLEAWRRVKGFPESDAPDNDELLLRVLLKATRVDPFILAQLFKITGLAPNIDIPNPQSGILGEVQEPPVQAAAVIAALEAGARRVSKGAQLGRRLAMLDRDLRTRVHAAVEAAMRHALERAGAKVRSKVRNRNGEVASVVASTPHVRDLPAALGRSVVRAAGLGDDELLDGAFDDVVTQFGAWVDTAMTQALNDVQAVVGLLNDAQKAELSAAAERGAQTAAEWLKQNLVTVAANRLYNPEPAAMLGEVDASVTVPMGIVRQALAIAGGDAPVGGSGSPLRSASGDPVGGIGTGPIVMNTLSDAGAAIEAYQWDYGTAPRTPFPPHESLDGLIFESFDDDALANDEGFPDVPYFQAGDHDGCFPAGTLVSGPPVRGATLRYHKGEVVTIRFASGQFLTATPNHPVLTDHGWVAAGLLDEGRSVIRRMDADRVTGLVPDDQEMPARIEDVAAAFGVDRGVVSRRVKVAPMDFNGDGIGSQVAVVWTDGYLGDGGDSVVTEPTGEATFGGTDPMVGVGLTAESRGASLLEGVGDTPFGIVGGLRPLHTLLSGQGGGIEPHPFADTPAGHTSGQESITDSPPRNTEPNSDAVLGLPTDIGVDDLLRWQFAGQSGGRLTATGESVSLGASAQQTPAGQLLTEERRWDTETSGGTFGRFPFEVSLDRVLHVEKRPFEGHVYNLQTEGHWYIADGIVVHNCVCDVVPLLILGAEGEAAGGEGE